MAGLLPLVFPFAQDWYVDVEASGCATGTGSQVAPFCNVEDAVEAASDGDTIHIAPGTYFENVVIDKDLALSGTAEAGLTIIDGRQAGTVVFVAAYTAVSLTALTMTNGSSTDRGAGLDCTAGSVVLLANSSVTGNHGTGIYAEYARLTLIDSNVSQNDSVQRAGGIGAIGSSLTMTESRVSQNTSGGVGGIDFGQGDGAGQRVAGGLPGWPKLTLRGCTVSENTGSTGGIGATGPVAIFDSTIRANIATENGGGINGYGVQLEIVNTLVAENTAGSQGGGLFVAAYVCLFGCIQIDSTLTITNATIAANSASSAGSGIWLTGDRIGPMVAPISGEIRNSIIWGNMGSQLELGQFASASVRYCDIEGGYPGVGNIDADPLHVDPINGDYAPSLGSPCIDAGDNRALRRGAWTDLLGLPRFVDDPATTDTGRADFLPLVHLPSGHRPARPVVDIGAHEYQ